MTQATTNHSNEQELLHAAFRSFDEAAHTLQQSYSALTARVEQMDNKLDATGDSMFNRLSSSLKTSLKTAHRTGSSEGL